MMSSSVRGVARYPGLGIRLPVLVLCQRCTDSVVQFNGLLNRQVQVLEDGVSPPVVRSPNPDLVRGRQELGGRYELSCDLVRALGHSCTLLAVSDLGQGLS